MGVEYKIRFSVPRELDMDMIISQLPDADAGLSEMPEFRVYLEPDGFYFLANSSTDATAQALRRLVDIAMSYSGQVVVEEP